MEVRQTGCADGRFGIEKLLTAIRRSGYSDFRIYPFLGFQK